MELVSYCVHDFNLSKFISVWGRACRSGEPFAHQRKDLKGVKYRKGRAIHITLLSVTTRVANLEAFLFNKTNSLRG